MIVNAYSVSMLLIAILTGLLAMILGPLSFRVYQRWDGDLSGEERTAEENRSYLLLLIAIVILYIRLLTSPLFYATLQSYLPSVQGAMCIFGVTQLHPTLSGVAQVLKPLVLLLIGGWLLLNRLDRTSETVPFFRRKFLYLALISPVVLADSVVDLFIFTGFRVETDVTCCTGFFDLPGRATALLSVSLLGPGYASYMMPLYYVSGISLLSCMILSYLFSRRRSFTVGIARTRFLVLSGTNVLLSIVNAVVTVLTLFEVIAPRVMKLPNHHCIYCLWQSAPLSIPATALFAMGTMAPIWAFLLYTMGRHEETIQPLQTDLKKLYLLGICCIAASVGIVKVMTRG